MRKALLISVAAVALLAPTVFATTSGLRGLKKAGRELLLATHTDRPSRVILPANYHDKAAWPVIMVLHGYGSNGKDMDFYAGISREAPNVGGFITIQANGTYDPTSHARFWNGKACCDHNEINPNDKAYLVGLVDEAKANYNVESEQVYAIGHSNGGLMAQILVCQESETFRGMVGLSPGVIPGKCWETKATKVLLVSGTEDLYLAPCVNADNVKRWGGYLKCGETPSLETRLDLDCEEGAAADYDSHYDQWKDHNCALKGAETAVEVWEGCEGPGGRSKVGLWTMEGSRHSPALSSAFTQKALRFLLE